MTYDASNLLIVSSLNGGAKAHINITSYDGNELGGSFTLAYKNVISPNIPFNASAAEAKALLESIAPIPQGTIAVSRTGPDGQKAYSWTVTFLSDYARTFAGSLPLFVADASSLTGRFVGVHVDMVRQGTQQEVQQLTVTTAGASAIGSNWYMMLSFNNQTTGQIPVSPSNITCNTAQTEVQRITSSTVDTTTSGGDDSVSMYLQFRMLYRDQVSGWIQANPNADGDCSLAAANIEKQLEMMPYFPDVVVSYASTGLSQGCMWDINFVSSVGDIDLLTIEAMNSVTGNKGVVGYKSVAGDDTVVSSVLVDGTVDTIKAHLEELSNVGTVTVSSSSISAKGECTWKITFDTKAGDLSLLEAVITDGVSLSTLGSSVTLSPVSVAITEVTPGTSKPLGGSFALSFRGERTTYLSYDASARDVSNALMALETVGEVIVARSDADENNGFTWTVTFLTELGMLDLMLFDGASLTGTVATGAVARMVTGVFPPFNSLDQVNGLPLGSAVITDLSSLSYLVGGLSQGIAYYFRTAASNAVGQGPFGVARIPFVIPEPQNPGPPVSSKLSVIDSTSLEVSFKPPLLDGGMNIDSYMVEYNNIAFADEVQSISVLCAVSNEIQVVSSSTETFAARQIVYISTSFQGNAISEIQFVQCDATGGSFRLGFYGYLTPSILYSADADTIKNALQDIEIINTVNVTFVHGATQACFANALHPQGGFTVEFTSVVGLAGDLSLMTSYTNNLQGLRRIDVTEQQKGDAPIGGTFRLSFRGFSTVDIPATATDVQLQTALNDIDSIPANGVTVTVVPAAQLANQYSRQWIIDFSSPELGGNVSNPLGFISIIIFSSYSGGGTRS